MDQTKQLEDMIKKMMLASIGVVVVTAEKSYEILGKLAEKGEEAVEKGKAKNEELKHNRAAKDTDAFLDSLTDEQMEELKAKILQRESNEQQEQ